MLDKRFTTSQTEKCPVCATSFKHKRRMSEPYSGHCDECRTTFYYKPFQEKPTAELDKDAEKRRCGCLGCGR